MSVTSYPNVESSYMENILNNSFQSSYNRCQYSYHAQYHGGQEVYHGHEGHAEHEGHVEGEHGVHEEHNLYPSAYDTIAGGGYVGEYNTADGNDSGVTSEGTEEYNDFHEDISNNDNTKKRIEAPLSAWKTKQLKLSVAGVMKRRKDANKRERKRMNGLNEAFEKLREHIPGGKKQHNKKLSKMETLQMANMYIRTLVNILEQQ